MNVFAWIDRRYALAAAALALLSLMLGVLAAGHDTFPVDVAVMSRAQALGSGYAPVGNLFNEHNGPMALLAIVGGAGLFFIRRRPDAALLFVLAAVVRPGLSMLKAAVDRPRPSGDIAVLDVVRDSSFPSGHVMTAAVFFGLWFLLAPEILPRRWVLPARAFVLALIALSALSRMWAGVHWLSDVYGGLLWSAALLAALVAVRPTLDIVCRRAGWLVRA